MADSVPDSNTTIVLNTDHKGLRKLREEVELIMIERTLYETKGNVTEAARRLGIARPTLYDLLSRHGLRQH